MVGNMLGKDHEGDRDIGDGNGGDILAVDRGQALSGLDEGEIRHGKDLHLAEDREVDDLELQVAGGAADHGEDRCNDIAGENAEDERDELCHLPAVDGAEHDGKESDQAADQADVGAGGGDLIHLIHDLTVFNDLNGDVLHHLAGGEVADGVAGQREADDGDRGADDDGRHQLVDPLDAGRLDDDGDHNVDQSGEDRAEDDPGEARFRGGRAAEGGKHGADEGEGGAQEDRAAELGEQQIDDGADACAKEGGGLGHAVSDDGRDGDGSRQNRQKLLEGENKRLAEGGSVVDVVDQFHVCLSFSLFSGWLDRSGGKIEKRTHSGGVGTVDSVCV